MVEAVLQAAAEVFAELGYARATTNKIALRAGVSIGSLYQYFPNKDSLLAELLAQHHADVHRVLDRALQRFDDPDVPFRSGIRQLLIDLVALHRANPALTRALSATVLRQSPAADGVHDEDDAHLVQRVAATLARRSDVRAGDHLAMALVLGQIASQLTRWLVHDAPPAVPFQTLLEESVELLSRYVSAAP
jgi:AcrR family transcriptional regulator